MPQYSRRTALKGLVSSLPVIWTAPVVNSVILPAHAQTSSCASSITASSLDSDNPFARYVNIVNADTEEVVASCGEGGGTAMASNLAPGEYWVFGDSDGEELHTISISTECSSETLTYTTDAAECTVLFATVSIPDGVITPGGGQTLTGGWGCGSGNQNCSGG